MAQQAPEVARPAGAPAMRSRIGHVRDGGQARTPWRRWAAPAAKHHSLSRFLFVRRRKNRPGIWPPRGSRREISGMREDVLGRPAGEVEARAVGQEAEAGGGQRAAPFACDQDVELFLE